MGRELTVFADGEYKLRSEAGNSYLGTKKLLSEIAKPFRRQLDPAGRWLFYEEEDHAER